MPELPEVETVKRVIEPQIQGLSVVRVEAPEPGVIAHPDAEGFTRLLTGQVFNRIKRRGKFLELCFTSGDRLVIHLRMTGCLLLTPAEMPAEKHTHVVLQLSGGRELRFSDTRRFGRLWFLKRNENDIYTGIEKLGLEPADPALSACYLTSRLGRRRKAIKSCLLDQSIIAGIGNIYSDEVLFSARIDPARPAVTLSSEEWERLAALIPERMSYFTEKNTIAAEDYLRTRGQDYRNTPFLQVYGHEGEPCPVCGSALCRTIIGGRSSIFCPHCQK